MAKYKGIPKKVKIGQRVYSIHIRNEADDPSLCSSYAYTMRTYDNIVLNDNMSRAMARSTLLHELLHAIRLVYGNDFAEVKTTEEDDDDTLEAFEHFFINLYEEPLITMLRDNPRLVAFIIGE